MLTLTSIPNLAIAISEKSDGSLRGIDNAQSFADINVPQLTKLIMLEHGLKILNDEDVTSENYVADVILTTKPNQAIGFVVGDCYPIILYSPDKKVLAQIHAGWKSLAQGIIASTISHLAENYMIDTNQLIAWIGPGIDAEHYVHTDKPTQVDWAGWSEVISKNADGYHIDLQRFIYNSLITAGFRDPQIITHPESTGTHPDKFFSHTRAKLTGEEDGRFLVASWMME